MSCEWPICFKRLNCLITSVCLCVCVRACVWMVHLISQLIKRKTRNERKTFKDNSIFKYKYDINIICFHSAILPSTQFLCLVDRLFSVSCSVFFFFFKWKKPKKKKLFKRWHDQIVHIKKGEYSSPPSTLYHFVVQVYGDSAIFFSRFSFFLTNKMKFLLVLSPSIKSIDMLKTTNSFQCVFFSFLM